MGKLKNSEATNPTVASIDTRPCLISASRSHLTSNPSENPIGSNPTSPIMDPSRAAGLTRKGRDVDISAAFREEEDDGETADLPPDWAGAKADADPARRARVAAAFIVVAACDDAGVKREREREESYLEKQRVVFVEVHLLPSKARIRGLNWDLGGDTDSDV